MFQLILPFQLDLPFDRPEPTALTQPSAPSRAETRGKRRKRRVGSSVDEVDAAQLAV